MSCIFIYIFLFFSPFDFLSRFLFFSFFVLFFLYFLSNISDSNDGFRSINAVKRYYVLSEIVVVFVWREEI